MPIRKPNKLQPFEIRSTQTTSSNLILEPQKYKFFKIFATSMKANFIKYSGDSKTGTNQKPDILEVRSGMVRISNGRDRS